MKVQLHFSSTRAWLTVEPESKVEQTVLNAFAGHNNQFAAEVLRTGYTHTFDQGTYADVVHVMLRPAPVPPPTLPEGAEL